MLAWSGSLDRNPSTWASWLALLTGPNNASSSSGRPTLALALGVLRYRGDEVVVDARTGDDPRGRGAVLPGVEVSGDGDGLHGRLQIRVVEDDDGRLATELEVDPLEIMRGALGDLHPGTDRAGDRDHGRRLVRHDRASRLTVAGDDVERAGREELGGDLRQEQGGLRCGVAGFEDDGVAGRQRRERPSRSPSSSGSSTA